MNTKKVILVYGLLMILLVGASVLLALQVRHFMQEREDPTLQFQHRIQDPEDIKQVLKQEEAKKQQDVLLTFSQNRSFRELATPVPRPTPTPIPPPTPTPVIPGRGFEIEFVTKNMAFLRRYDKQTITCKVGDIIDSALGKFKIIELIPSPDFPQIKVQDVKTGTAGTITKQVKR